MKLSYEEEAGEYYRAERWRERLLAARLPRSIVVRAGTLAVLGGASALAQILAACSSAASSKETLVGTSAEGSYKWSKYPLVEKYNFRNLPWGGSPHIDGTLVMTGSGASNWDFVRQRLTSYGSIMDTLINKRYGAGADMNGDEMEGHIADKWSHARDFSYWDFHVRPGVHYHDVAPVNGRLCTAEDVKYCLDLYRTEGLNRSGLDIIDRVEVLGDKETVRVYTKKPVLWLDLTLASSDYFIFAREHREGPKDRWERQPIGTGPFKMVFQRVGAGGAMETVRHEGFGRRDDRWAGYQLPFLKGFKQISLGADVTQKAAIRSGQIDYYSASDLVELQDLLSTNPELIVQVQPANSTYPVYPWLLNLRDPLFQDIRVRRALSMAVNRREMIDTAAGGLGVGGYTVSWTWLGLSDPLSPEDLGPWQQFNPAQAKQLLGEAGYPNGFEMEYMVAEAPTNQDILMQQYLDHVGVRVRFNQVESVVLTTARTNKTYKHAILGTPSSGYDPIKLVRERFLPDSNVNWDGINDPVMTDLVERATYTLDADEQRKLLWQIHERDLDQCYRIERYTRLIPYLAQPWLHNVASATQGQFNAYGYHQVGVAWIDDKAPTDRAGHLKA